MKIFLFLLFFVVLISVFVPFHLSSGDLEFLDHGVQIVSALSSLLTLLIAILLFNKLGIEKSILNKKTDIAIQILEDVNKLNFLMVVAGKQYAILNFYVSSSERDVKEYWPMYKEYNLLFGLSYIEKLMEIQKLIENLFTPREVVKAFENLKFIHGGMAPADMVNYIIVTSADKKAEEHPSLFNGHQITLEEYSRNWQIFIEAIQSWLNKNSSFSVDLNIFSR